MNYQEKAEVMLGYVPALRSRESVRPLRNVTEGEYAVLIYLANEHDGATAGQITTAQAVIGVYSAMMEYLGEEDSEHLLQILDKLMAYGQTKEK